MMRAEQPEGPYTLVGYSYGAIVAFEMACILQDEGIESKVILLDSSHHYMATYRKAYRMAYGIPQTVALSDNNNFQTELLISLTSRFANFDERALRTHLSQLPDWESRMAHVTEMVMKSGLFDEQETFIWACNSLRAKFSAADR